MFSNALALQSNIPPLNATRNQGLCHPADNAYVSQVFAVNFSISSAPPLVWVQGFDSQIFKKRVSGEFKGYVEQRKAAVQLWKDSENSGGFLSIDFSMTCHFWWAHRSLTLHLQLSSLIAAQTFEGWWLTWCWGQAYFRTNIFLIDTSH